MARRSLFPALLLAIVLYATACFAKKGDKDLFRVGGPVTIPAGERVGDVAVLGGPLTIDGDVDGDVATLGGPVYVNGKVSSDVAIFGGPIQLGNKSTIGGDLAVFGGPLQRAPGAVVHGDIANPHGLGIFGGGLAVLFTIGLAMLIPVSLILALIGYAILRDQRINVMVAEADRETGTVVLAGLAALAATIFVMVLSFKAHIGPVRAIVLLLFLVTLFVGYTGVSAWIGRHVSRTSGPLAVVLIGALIISVLQAIPLIGGVAFLIFMFMALGIAITTGLGTAPGWVRF